jgi:hypothetical protein
VTEDPPATTGTDAAGGAPSGAEQAAGRGRGRRRTIVAVVVVVVLAVVASVLVLTAAPTAPSRATGTTPARFLGAFGVEARWVLAQNRLKGTTAWRIPAAVPVGAIEGFANENYARAGERVGFYVSTSARTYHVDAYRMGWYQGKGAHLVWSSRALRGQRQPACRFTAGINLVSCANWHRSFNVVLLRHRFVQGDYLFKLVAGPRAQAYVPLTIWAPRSRATYLIMARTFVEQGWNAFGGYSYYQGQGPCPPGAPAYPVCNRARVVSFDRPYDTGAGSSDFLGDEYPLVRFCEEHGLDVAYVTDVTVDEHPSILQHHRVLLSLGHDESWSYHERLGLQRAMARGLNVVFFGAASVLRHVRLQASPLGPDRQEVDYRDAGADPLNGHGPAMQVTGNTWSSPPSSWSANPVVGEGYSGYLYPGLSAAFVVADAASWVFAGTGLHDGSVLPRVIASDIDHVDQYPGMPTDLTVLGHSPIPLAKAYTNQGTWGSVTYSDMTYYTDPLNHAGVIDTGNNNWINAMGYSCPRAGRCTALELQRITGNILRLFGQGPAGRRRPSRSNLGSIHPAGS